jgi:hypothetical protein
MSTPSSSRSQDASLGATLFGGGIALSVILALSLVPMQCGPMLAPRVLPVFATELCEGEPVAARTVTVVTRSRKGTSSSWSLACEDASGVVTREDGMRPAALSWALFNGGLALVVALAVWMHRRLDRAVLGGRQ